MIDVNVEKEVEKILKNKSSIDDLYKFFLIDYFKAMSQCFKNFKIDVSLVLNMLSENFVSVSEDVLFGVMGHASNGNIVINSELDVGSKKLFFFHELTHVLQTRENNCCGLYNGENGMFLLEAQTQYLAQVLYCQSENITNSIKSVARVNGTENHSASSVLKIYKFPGNILSMLALAINMNLNDLIFLSFFPNCREILKSVYEKDSCDNFEIFMSDLEKLYQTDYVLIKGHFSDLDTTELVFIYNSSGDYSFSTNLHDYDLSIKNIQLGLMSSYFMNNDDAKIFETCDVFETLLSSESLALEFKKSIAEIKSIRAEKETQILYEFFSCSTDYVLKNYSVVYNTILTDSIKRSFENSIINIDRTAKTLL